MNLLSNHLAINSIICIVGSTAVGKTAISLALAEEISSFAKEFSCPEFPAILSADSRQVFKEIPIGTAQVLPAEQGKIPHFFMGNRSINEQMPFNAGLFAKEARAILEKEYQKKRIAFLVGGSGLYVQALCEGFHDFPDIDPIYRREATFLYQNQGLKGLRAELQKLDPLYFERVDRSNPQRMMRALEVSWATHKPYSSFVQEKKEWSATKNSLFTPIWVGLELPKEDLQKNIETRVDHMLATGLIEECSKVLSYREHNALQTVGYSETFDYLDGKIDLKTLRQLIILHTRQYAKKQMTWFKKNKDIRWFSPKDRAGIREYLGVVLNLKEKMKR